MIQAFSPCELFFLSTGITVGRKNQIMIETKQALEQLLAAGAINVDGRPDAAVGQAAIEVQLHVAGSLEFLKDHFVHAAFGAQEDFVKHQVRLQGSDTEPKLVCIDLQPYTTTQAPDRSDILNIGGFSDAVFSVVASFLSDDAGHFVAEVEAVEL
jgi:hypothetical protein